MTRRVMLAMTGSGDAVEFALADDGGCAWCERVVTPHATEELAGLAQRALAAAAEQNLEITAVGVDVGPGSFSGTRVVLAQARAFAWARQLPLHGYDAMVLLYHALPQPVPRAVTVLDARRGELFAALWRDGVPDCGGKLWPERQLVRALSGETWLAAGSGTALLVAAGAAVQAAAEQQPRAATIARLHCAGLPGAAGLAARYVRGAVS